ncbi:SRPBCC domain-containing protein [Leucobacter sp. cx-42]|uniref:SRPBCC family protein n=1 Tax=unclassified Leucobacter TaxID=2621730 RepID=UPI00165D9CE0|nr:MULTISPECIES: SRPBCC domain-containing protein [unclassified Leucobacter]MBC9953503.1 SRPBCC domain-containing protein [Leucobacter sp. cx-42]
MIPLGPVVARTRTVAPRELVWSFIADAVKRETWWSDLVLTAELGAEVTEQWSEGEGDAAVGRDAFGTVDVCSVGHAIGFRWRERGDETETAVLITLRAFDGGTSVTVTETGFDKLPNGAARASASLEGWSALLRYLIEALPASAPAAADDAATAKPAPATEPATENFA